MSNFFKSTKKLSLVMSALLLVITLTAGSFAFVTNGLPENQPIGEQPSSDNGAAPEEEGPVSDLEDTAFEEEPGEGLPVQTMAISLPTSLKAVYLVPGTDFVKEKDMSAEAVMAELDEAVEAAADLGMNAIVLDTTYNTDTIYETSGSVALFPGEDVMRHGVEAARAKGLGVYARFDSSLYPELDRLSANAAEFASRYRLDGILIDGYENESPKASYREYARSGGSIGFHNYLLQASAEKVRAVAKAVRAAAPDTAVGLLANAVWANKSDNKAGSETAAAYSSLINGHADTRFYIAHKFVDFLAVEAFTLSTDEAAPFDATVGWWNGVAEAAKMPMYVVHAADKLGESGWPDDMMTQQAAEISHLEAYGGSMFNTLSKMPTEGGAQPMAAAEPAPAPKPTPMPAPSQPLKPVPVGVSAPQAEPVEAEPAAEEPADEGEYIDALEGDSSGPSSPSGSGALIREIYPTGIIMAQEDDMVDITVTARKGADVIASINGEEIRLHEDRASGSYAEYTGHYDVPASDGYESGEYQYLGGLSVRASLNGKSQTFDGAFLSRSSNRVPVEVIAEQARTYPAGKKDNVPIPTLYPLPQGTIDYVVSGVSEYTSAKGEHFKFVTLESGVRVETKDIDEASYGPSANNRISGIAVSAAPDSRYTYVTLKTEEKVAFSFSYSANGLAIEFANTTRVPADKKLKSNPLFSEASWTDDDTLNLEFQKPNGFMGYKAYYDANDNLVFRFKNPPKSIKGTKVAIDPGHGGQDRGGEGSDRRYPETVITHALAGTVAEELESRGANVLVLDADGIEGPERAQLAEKWGADMLISLHCNTSSINPNASGTEAFYFYPFSYQLAAQGAARVSKGYGVPNRGAKLSYYHVTLSPQMPSILLETGFMTNEGDFGKLIKTANHRRIADSVADSVEASIKAAYSGSTAGGTESSGSTVSTSNDDEDISYAGSDVDVDDMWFEKDSVTIGIGESLRLGPIVEPEDAEGAELSWRSSSSSVVTVDSGGRIKGIKAGTATVSATASRNGGKKATVKVEVVESGSSLADTGLPLSKAGDAYQDESSCTVYQNVPLRLLICSEDGKQVKNTDFKWRSSKTSVATVDQNGVVTGKSRGNSCKIIAETEDFAFEWDVDVSKDILKITGIKLEKAEIYLQEKGSKQIKWVTSPGAAQNLAVSWRSNKSVIASVDANGLVTGKKEGDCTITGSSGNIRVQVQVYVVKDPIVVDYIDIGSESLEMRVGDEDYFSAEVGPEDNTDNSVTWRSSNSGIVSIDEKGNIKALKKGTATITCTAANNRNATATCKITVY